MTIVIFSHIKPKMVHLYLFYPSDSSLQLFFQSISLYLFSSTPVTPKFISIIVWRGTCKWANLRYRYIRSPNSLL